MANTAKIIRLDVAGIVDALGAIKAQIADLKKTEDALKAQLIQSGVSEADGATFRATVSVSERNVIDWKAIAEKLEPSRQLVTAHTSVSESVTVRVTARKS